MADWEKVVVDGRVAVAVSYGFGAGWSTWNTENAELLMFHPEIIGRILKDRRDELTSDFIESLVGGEEPGCDAGGRHDFYVGGRGDLVVEWVEQGAKFRIREYDGCETLKLLGDMAFNVA